MQNITCDANAASEMPCAANPYTKRIYHAHLKDAETIPDTNGSGYYRGIGPRVGIITDDFMFNYYAGALDLVYLEKVRYREIIDSQNLEMILYVSCWLGMLPPDEEGIYEYRPGPTAAFMPELVDYAHGKGIKVLFQSIEDPTNYKLYLPIAKACDFIFTSAVEMIPKYVADTGNKNVFYQPYGVNPLIHNPIGFMKRRSMSLYRDCVFFAGSWYELYPKRCEDTVQLFDGVLGAGKKLIVADRALNYDAKAREGRVFPEKYNEYIIPPIEHKLLQKVHKLFDFAINLNTVTDSETMGAMRVLEVQALGSLLISNYAKSTENFYPDMCIARSSQDVVNYLTELEEQAIVRQQLAGIRRLLTDATVYDRLNLMFLRVGYPFAFEEKTVYVLYEELTDGIERQFHAQSYREKRLMSLSQFQREGICDGFAVVLQDACPISEFFLTDATNAFKFANVSYVTCVPVDDYAVGYDYVAGVQQKYNTLYALDRVGPLDFDRLLNDDRLDGFAIAL